LDSFIKNWKIDPIYEDEDGVEFFDNLSIVKIKKGISLKSQGYDNSEIFYHINRILADVAPVEEKAVPVEKIAPKTSPVEAPTEEVVEEVIETAPVKSVGVMVLDEQAAETPFENAVEPLETKNVTIDVTSQTLQMLADAVASKITTDIKQQLLLENPLKETNDALSKQVEELLEDNKKLAERIQHLEGNKFCFLTWLENLIVSLKKIKS